MSKINGKSRDKKKKKPCGDGYRAVKQEVKGSDKPKIKCVPIKKRGKGSKDKEDDKRPFEPKGPRKFQTKADVKQHEKQHSQFKKPPSGVR